MTTDNNQFREYVTGTSFVLTLSRRMIEMLCQMDHYGYTYGLTGTARSLADRGLAEWTDAQKFAGEQAPEFRRYQLTEAGRTVLPLLKLSGLYVQYPEIPEAVMLPEPVITVRRREDQP